MAEPDQSFDQVALSELSRHYDTTLWAVTGLWAAAIGGLFLYVRDHFDLWLAVFGVLLTVGGMYFAKSFRALRRQVHERMSTEVRLLHVSSLGFRQWDMFLVLFLALVGLWTRLLLKHSSSCSLLWIALGLVAAVTLLWFWWSERAWNSEADV
jgi:threonine/homoserine efflux transporter RhtA